MWKQLDGDSPWGALAQAIRRKYPTFKKEDIFAGDIVIILDEAQDSYEDDALWNVIIKDVGRMVGIKDRKLQV